MNYINNTKIYQNRVDTHTLQKCSLNKAQRNSKTLNKYKMFAVWFNTHHFAAPKVPPTGCLQNPPRNALSLPPLTCCGELRRGTPCWRAPTATPFARNAAKSSSGSPYLESRFLAAADKTSGHYCLCIIQPDTNIVRYWFLEIPY